MKLVTYRCSGVDEVVASLTAKLKEDGITEASIVSVIGGVDQITISSMRKEDATKDVLNEYDEPLELSGTGSVDSGNVHIHVTLGREGDQALFGHLHSAFATTWFVDVHILTN